MSSQSHLSSNISESSDRTVDSIHPDDIQPSESVFLTPINVCADPSTTFHLPLFGSSVTVTDSEVDVPDLGIESQLDSASASGFDSEVIIDEELISVHSPGKQCF